MNYKVAIIGAGPAGVSAGIELLKNGMNCCIIDKSTFPRNKTCGGLITQKTIDLIDKVGIDIKEKGIIKNTVNKVSILNCGDKVTEFSCYTPFYLVNRFEFDDVLLQHYIALGGVFYSGRRAVNIDINNKSIATNTGEVFYYEYLIGADGAQGITEKYVTRKKLTYAFGLEAEISNSELEIDNGVISLDVGLFDDGYAWCFPKGEYSTIGFAHSYKKDVDYKGFFEKHLQDVYKYKKEASIKGAFLPYGWGSKNAVNADAGIMLIGDSAGFIDAITGEGTYYAIQSGQLAAECIVKYGDRSILEYEKAAKVIFKLVKKSWKCITFFYKKRSTILKIIHNRKGLITFFIENQVSKDQYQYNIIKLLFDYFKIKYNKKRV